jgi:hypothetical protein
MPVRLVGDWGQCLADPHVAACPPQRLIVPETHVRAGQ